MSEVNPPAHQKFILLRFVPGSLDPKDTNNRNKFLEYYQGYYLLHIPGKCHDCPVLPDRNRSCGLTM